MNLLTSDNLPSNLVSNTQPTKLVSQTAKNKIGRKVFEKFTGNYQNVDKKKLVNDYITEYFFDPKFFKEIFRIDLERDFGYLTQNQLYVNNLLYGFTKIKNEVKDDLTHVKDTNNEFDYTDFIRYCNILMNICPINKNVTYKLDENFKAKCEDQVSIESDTENTSINDKNQIGTSKFNVRPTSSMNSIKSKHSSHIQEKEHKLEREDSSSTSNPSTVIEKDEDFALLKVNAPSMFSSRPSSVSSQQHSFSERLNPSDHQPIVLDAKSTKSDNYESKKPNAESEVSNNKTKIHHNENLKNTDINPRLKSEEIAKIYLEQNDNNIRKQSASMGKFHSRINLSRQTSNESELDPKNPKHILKITDEISKPLNDHIQKKINVNNSEHKHDDKKNINKQSPMPQRKLSMESIGYCSEQHIEREKNLYSVESLEKSPYFIWLSSEIDAFNQNLADLKFYIGNLMSYIENYKQEELENNHKEIIKLISAQITPYYLKVFKFKYHLDFQQYLLGVMKSRNHLQKLIQYPWRRVFRFSALLNPYELLNALKLSYVHELDDFSFNRQFYYQASTVPQTKGRLLYKELQPSDTGPGVFYIKGSVTVNADYGEVITVIKKEHSMTYNSILKVQISQRNEWLYFNIRRNLLKLVKSPQPQLNINQDSELVFNCPVYIKPDDYDHRVFFHLKAFGNEEEFNYRGVCIMMNYKE